MDTELAIAQAPCSGCIHYQNGTVFELCGHPDAKYSVAGKVDQHTVGHMRRYYGGCGADGRLRVAVA